ncbi:PIN domain-containing protein [Candidatus Woesearchaeota archaeon]|nr:PIN domain-containing protein [Candidatus Woesearchaeota archaeon]
MNGSNIKAVIDTNVIFMALYNEESKAGRIIKLARKNKLKLFSADNIKEEIKRVLKREYEYTDEEIFRLINELPIEWVKKENYIHALDKTKVKHKADKPLEALSLVLGCEILSADAHFKDRIDINKLLEIIEKSP